MAKPKIIAPTTKFTYDVYIPTKFKVSPYPKYKATATYFDDLLQNADFKASLEPLPPVITAAEMQGILAQLTGTPHPEPDSPKQKDDMGIELPQRTPQTGLPYGLKNFSWRTIRDMLFTYAMKYGTNPFRNENYIVPAASCWNPSGIVWGHATITRIEEVDFGIVITDGTGLRLSNGNFEWKLVRNTPNGPNGTSFVYSPDVFVGSGYHIILDKGIQKKNVRTSWTLWTKPDVMMNSISLIAERLEDGVIDSRDACIIFFLPITDTPETFIAAAAISGGMLYLKHGIPDLITGTIFDFYSEYVLKRLLKLVSKDSGNLSLKTLRKNLSVGADVEVSIVDSDGLFHSASEFFTDSVTAVIGSDGNADTVEFRPSASTNPLEVADEIDDIMKQVDKMLPDGYDLFGGGGKRAYIPDLQKTVSINRSTGVHIHFGHINNSALFVKKDMQDICRWMDTIIFGQFGQFPGFERAEPDKYGFPSDYRCQATHSKFPHRGFEYRSLPNICISNKITRALLTLSRMIAISYMSGIKPPPMSHSPKLGELKFLDLYEENLHIIKPLFELPKDTRIDIPILKNWLSKTFSKEKESEVVVESYTVDGARTDLWYPNLTIHNPSASKRKLIAVRFVGVAKKCYIAGELNNGVVNILGRYGELVSTKIPEEFMNIMKNGIGASRIKNSAVIILSEALLHRLENESHYSRDRVRFLIQELASKI